MEGFQGTDEKRPGAHYAMNVFRRRSVSDVIRRQLELFQNEEAELIDIGCREIEVSKGSRLMLTTWAQ